MSLNESLKLHKVCRSILEHVEHLHSSTSFSNSIIVYLNAALLPPHKKPAANTVFYITPNNINNHPHKYDEPKQEPDTNRNLPHPSYSHTVPEGSGGEVKLPADAGPVSTSGKKTSLFLLACLFVGIYFLCVDIANCFPFSPSSSRYSKTFGFRTNARIFGGVTLIPSIRLTLSVISFTHPNCPIIHS